MQRARQTSQLLRSLLAACETCCRSGQIHLTKQPCSLDVVQQHSSSIRQQLNRLSTVQQQHASGAACHIIAKESGNQLQRQRGHVLREASSEYHVPRTSYAWSPNVLLHAEIPGWPAQQHPRLSALAQQPQRQLHLLQQHPSASRWAYQLPGQRGMATRTEQQQAANPGMLCSSRSETPVPAASHKHAAPCKDLCSLRSPEAWAVLPATPLLYATCTVMHICL